MIDLLLILLTIFLVLLNAFFVASEFGIVKLRQTRVQEIKEQYGFKGRILETVHKNLDAYLSACQLGITLASVGLGWVGESAFKHVISPLLIFIGMASNQVTEMVSLLLVFTLISFLHIVVGELMPKSLAIRQSEKVSIWTSFPLYIFYWTMFPFIIILNYCSNILLKIIKLDATNKKESSYSSEEIQLILHASHLHGELTKDETEIIEQTLEFADLKVTEVMRPFEEIVKLDIHKSIEQNMQIMKEQRYTRYPVYDSQTNEILGFIHIKDLMFDMYTKKEIIDLRTYIRPILKISHKILALELLRIFRDGASHFALIYQNKTQLMGFVTFDNLLHLIMGRIKDEFHKTKDDWTRNTDGSITINGSCSIFSVERALDINIKLSDEEDENLHSIGDLILARHKSKIKDGDTLTQPEFNVSIEKIEKNHIIKMKIFPKKL